MKVTRAEADEIYRAFSMTFGYLGLIHKMHGYVPEGKPEDAQPFHVPFHENADQAYEAWTPELRGLLADLIEDSIRPE